MADGSTTDLVGRGREEGSDEDGIVGLPSNRCTPLGARRRHGPRFVRERNKMRAQADCEALRAKHAPRRIAMGWAERGSVSAHTDGRDR